MTVITNEEVTYFVLKEDMRYFDMLPFYIREHMRYSVFPLDAMYVWELLENGMSEAEVLRHLRSLGELCTKLGG